MNQSISGKKAKQLVDKGAILVDVRDPVSFRNGTISGAVNMSLRQLSQLQKHPKNTAVVLFGQSAEDPTLTSALNYMTLYGFTKVYSLGALDNWNK